jgi:DNA-binding NarL/FixJ family response regulator
MVIDDHPIIHRALETLVETEASLSLDWTATSAAESMRILRTATPGLVILDLSLGDADGIYLIQKIHRRHPKMPILIYSMSEEQLFGERTALAGAKGYVMKTSNPAVLREAIHTILDGGLFFSEVTWIISPTGKWIFSGSWVTASTRCRSAKS